MNYQLAEIFKSKITGAVYADRLAGLVRDVSKNVPIANGNSVLKTYPVACGIEQDCTSDSVLRHLVPDAKHRSIIYFEDKGVVFSSKDGHYLTFISYLQLTCWINLKKLKQADCDDVSCSLSGLIAADIIYKLWGGIFSEAPYSKIQILKISEMEKSSSIFSKYSYDDKNSYLIYPYDYFGLLIETKFSVSQSCLTEIEITDADC